MQVIRLTHIQHQKRHKSFRNLNIFKTQPEQAEP